MKMQKEEIKELVNEVLEDLVINKKKVDIGIIKLEIRTDGDSMWAVGSKSGLYEDVKNDLPDNKQVELEDALKKLQDEFIKFQELFVSYIEKE